MKLLIILILGIIINEIGIIFTRCGAESIRYLSVERPKVVDFNTKFVKDIRVTCRRHSRKDPIHYCDVHFELVRAMDNRAMVDMYAHQWLTNGYQPSFVEMHTKWCDFLHKDRLFGPYLRQGKLAKPCPHLPGVYELYNLTLPAVAFPRNLPFTKARFFANGTWAKPLEHIALGYIDAEIKTWRKNGRK